MLDERVEVFSHPRRDLTSGRRSNGGSQSVTARRWAVVLTIVESICAVDVATVSEEDGRGAERVERFGMRRSGRYISRVSTYKKSIKRAE